MTAISSYFAQVGVGIDKSSVNAVSGYLKSIEKQFLSFQGRVQKTLNLPVRVRMNRAIVQKDIQRSLNLASKSARTRLTLDARLSRTSLTDMKNQVKTSLSGITISPSIRPRVYPGVGGRGSGGGVVNSPRGKGRNTDRTANRGEGFNPWHNPMMIGGGTGAFMRYGLFSLPMVAGVFGLNALSNTSAELQSQKIAMRMTAGESMGADGKMRDGDYYLNFLDKLGDRLGKTTQMMTPFFTQMLAGAKGTALEPHLESGFENLLQYSSVMGLGDESTKGAIRAFVQMIL